MFQFFPYSPFQGLCLADINETLGKETLEEFKNFGDDKVIFVKCDIRVEADIEGK